MGILAVSTMQVLGFLVLFGLLASPTFAKTRHYDFTLKETPYTRLCNTKSILTVNGRFPGPTIYARKGDTVVVRVHNQGNISATLHWHGVDQPRNSWSDGPEYVTQCPLQPGASFTQTIRLSWEEGTLWWHAHSDWTRATVYGAIVILPRIHTTYPFPKPHKEYLIMLGEWWKEDVQRVYDDAQRTGLDPTVSDAYTINGQPGDLYDCSKRDTFTALVEHGKRYLLRVINAAVQDELFFAVAGHNITVVGTDGRYTKPFTTDYIMITPGQTMNVLLNASQAPGRYYMAASPYEAAPKAPYNGGNTTAILQYVGADNKSSPQFPFLPLVSDNDAATVFTAGLRSLVAKAPPFDVPQTIHECLLMTLAVNLQECPECTGGQGIPAEARLASSMNNVSFQNPQKMDILEAYYRNMSSGVYETDFPPKPPSCFNFTKDNLTDIGPFTRNGTKVIVLEYNTSVEVVLQGTNINNGSDNHPMHLHGYSFYTVGMGFGNWDKEKDPLKYNLVDPPLQNTVGVPKNGWVAVRFRATNPGVWFMHCHLDRHATWGMDTVFIVKNGKTPEQQLRPRPPDMPPCYETEQIAIWSYAPSITSRDQTTSYLE